MAASGLLSSMGHIYIFQRASYKAYSLSCLCPCLVSRSGPNLSEGEDLEGTILKTNINICMLSLYNLQDTAEALTVGKK